MAELLVNLPSMLADCNAGERVLRIEAATLGQALEQLRENHPLLRRHLFTENDVLRRNVLIFLNDENIAWIENAQETPIRGGDQLHIVPAVSGGCDEIITR